MDIKTARNVIMKLSFRIILSGWYIKNA